MTRKSRAFARLRLLIVVFVLCHSNKHRGIFPIVMRLQFVYCYRVLRFLPLQLPKSLHFQIVYTFAGIFDIVFAYIIDSRKGIYDGSRFGRYCGALYIT